MQRKEPRDDGTFLAALGGKIYGGISERSSSSLSMQAKAGLVLRYELLTFGNHESRG